VLDNEYRNFRIKSKTERFQLERFRLIINGCVMDAEYMSLINRKIKLSWSEKGITGKPVWCLRRIAIF